MKLEGKVLDKKDSSLDFLRVLSMFLVIVIHMANCYCRNFANISGFSFSIACIFNILARVSVPIFFMISGALLIPKKLTKEKYIFKVKRMVIVLVLWTFIYILFEYFYLGTVPNFLHLFLEPSRAHLWFMYAIICLYIALPFINKMANNLTKNEENLFMGLWFLASIFIYAIKILKIGKIVYNIPIVSGTYYLGYFLLGYILYKRINKDREKFKNYNSLFVLLFIFSNLLIIFITLIVSFRNGHTYKMFLTYSNPLMIMSSLSFYCFFLINNNKSFNFVSLLSQFSFGIYLVHGIFLEILKQNIDFLSINSIIGIPLFTILLFLVSYCVIYLLQKIPKINKYIC